MSRLNLQERSKYKRLFDNEVKKFLKLHNPECLLEHKELTPFQLYQELALHLHAYNYYLPFMAKKIWEDKRGMTLEEYYFEVNNELWAAERQIKKVYLPLAYQFRQTKTKKLAKLVNQNTYEKLLKKAVDYRDERVIKYLNLLAYDLRLKKIKVKIKGDKKKWSDYLKFSKLQNRENLEHNFIRSNSCLAIAKRDKRGILHLTRPSYNKGHSQYCVKCGKEMCVILQEEENKGNSCGLYYTSDGKITAVRSYKEKLSNGQLKTTFLCSRKCYDSFRIGQKRKISAS